MKSIWHWIIPTKRNKFHPHLIRSSGLITAAIIIAIVPAIYNRTTLGSSQVLGYATDINISDLHSVSNNERSKVGLTPYKLNTVLNAAATAKANDMFTDDYWAHDAPDGTTPWYFFESAGYDYSAAGENLAKGFNTSAGVVNGWMNSPGHKANVLGEDFVDVGYAVVNGVLLGEETTLVVAMYGLPYAPPAPVDTVATTPSTTSQPVQPTPQPTTAHEAAKPTTRPQAPSTQTPSKSVDTEEGEQDIALVTAPTSSNDDRSQSAAPAVQSALSLNPALLYSGLNWAQKVVLFMFSILILIYIMQHTIVWRRARSQGVKDVLLRTHPIGQLSVILVMAIVTLLSGVGSVL